MRTRRTTPKRSRRGADVVRDQAVDQLSPKRQMFVHLVLQPGMSSAEAYRRAYGVKASTAETNGPRLLRNAQVARAVAKARARLAAKLELTAENTLRELARIAFFDPAGMYDEKGRLLSVKDMPEDTRRAIAGIRYGKDGITIKFAPKVEALDKLMRHLGLYPVEAADTELKYTQLVMLGKKLHDARKAKELGKQHAATAATGGAAPTPNEQPTPAA